MRDVTEFDDADAAHAGELIAAACASRAWRAAIVAGRPYGTAAALRAASDTALAGLAWSEVEQALAAHPRIGDQPQGSDREAAWSRQEQSAAADPEAALAAALRAANIAYEERFGHVFLICATGRGAADILAEARRRLANEADAERAEVRRELRDIVRLRLARTFG